jgi:hypothetical protein
MWQSSEVRFKCTRVVRWMAGWLVRARCSEAVVIDDAGHQQRRGSKSVGVERVSQHVIYA